MIQPVIPDTIARSLAIGSPADGLFAARAIRETDGWAAAVSDQELTAGIRLLAETSGVFTETAGGVTVAAALALAESGHLKADDELVLCITGNGLKTVDVVGRHHSRPADHRAEAEGIDGAGGADALNLRRSNSCQ